MIVEAVIGIIVLTFAYSIGYQHNEPNKRTAERPEKWEPQNHDEMLRACGIVCGEYRVKSYNSIYGKCECK